MYVCIHMYIYVDIYIYVFKVTWLYIYRYVDVFSSHCGVGSFGYLASGMLILKPPSRLPQLRIKQSIRAVLLKQKCTDLHKAGA